MRDISCIPFSFPGIPQVRCAFTTRLGGMSAAPFDSANISLSVGDDPQMVSKNITNFKTEFGIRTWASLEQVHGTTMVFAPDETGSRKGDGMGTDQPGNGLVIKTADCQPILLTHRSGRYVAGLHCGWRGNRAGFPKLGVQAFCRQYDLIPEDVLAVRGPSLGPGRSEFVNFETEWEESFRPWFNEATRTMNLWRLTRDQLTAAGLRRENIFSLDLCTYDLPELFFSYRREKKTGRQAGVIWMEE